MKDASPLRYPGGKWRIAKFFERLIAKNDLYGCHYIEPYAGGASLGLSLMFTGHVSEIHLNDLDPAIHAFWHSVLYRNRDFAQIVDETPITPDEWENQRAIYKRGLTVGRLSLGFATFYLNRTNHSGILNGGMIGGKKQCGEWRVNARFNRADLKRRIERVAQYKNRIHLSCDDALRFLRSHRFSKSSLKYLDPPYYRPGKRLYLNAYASHDHKSVCKYVKTLSSPWVVSYDDVPQIRELYRGLKSCRIKLIHTARHAKSGEEILYFANALSIPRLW